MLIGLTGFKGSGKSVVARHLTLRHQYIRRPFAYHLKAMMSALGVPAEILDGSNFDKATPLTVLGEHTARETRRGVSVRLCDFRVQVGQSGCGQ